MRIGNVVITTKNGVIQKVNPNNKLEFAVFCSQTMYTAMRLGLPKGTLLKTDSRTWRSRMATRAEKMVNGKGGVAYA